MRQFRIFLLKTGFFFTCLYLCFAFLVFPWMNEKVYGLSTEAQIDKAFSDVLRQKHQVIILGNSHFSFGVNPDKISWESYNFSFVNDFYNQMLYKLKFLLKNNERPDILILGLDYFQFSLLPDSRNYAYVNYFEREYLEPYAHQNYKLKHYLSLLNPMVINDYQHGSKITLLDNGQSVFEGSGDMNVVKDRSINRLKIQEESFEEILALAKKNDIKVLLIMQPLRSFERTQYREDEIREFYSYIQSNVLMNENVNFIDFSNLNWEPELYRDFTHLNNEGADKFSLLIDSVLNADYYLLKK